MTDVDPVIRRIERTALIWCATTAAAALAIRPDLPSVAGGIVGGGLLTFVSLFAIRTSVDAILAAAGHPAPVPAPADAGGEPGPNAPDPDAPADAPADAPVPAARRRASLGIAVKLAGRVGLLGLAAYVMIARLRLHPIGLLIGATSLVAGATLEAVRGLRRS